MWFDDAILKDNLFVFVDTLYILSVEIGRGIDCPLTRLVSELICYVSSEMLNTAHSLALIRSILSAARCYASAAYAVRPSVRLSVRLSRSWTVSKRINTSSNFCNRRIASPFWFFHTIRHCNIPQVG